MNPGKFDSLVAHLVDTISPFLDEPSQCEQIFSLIIQQVIKSYIFYLKENGITNKYSNKQLTSFFSQ